MDKFKTSDGATPAVQEIRLVPSGGGVFEVAVDGATVFSKKALGRHAEPGEVVGLIENCLRR